MKRNNGIVLAVVAIALVVCGFAYYYTSQKEEVLRVSTTTSLFDTGLLDAIENDFENRTNYNVQFIAVGTGIAIQHAENGDVDCTLVHAPSLEKEFLENGYGVNRRIIAYNYFAIVGPEGDPAGINGMGVLEAMEKIADSESLFVSRDDKSGTNTKELELWKLTGHFREELIDEDWYKTTGQGMGSTLIMADELNGYTMADMGTYLKYYVDDRVNLRVFIEGGKELMNVYSVMAANPEVHSDAKFDGAMEFIDYLTTDDIQQLIGEYGKDTYGRSLFYPAVGIVQNHTGETYDDLSSIAFIEGSECPERFRL